jgi:ABC-2 type transport system permease protein
MAVYKRTYARYSGPLTNERWRFAILPRYALKSVFAMRFSTAALLLALVPHLIALVIIYLRNNIDALLSLDIRPAGGALAFVSVDGNFFLVVFTVETFVSFFIVAFLGPGLISPDLANNAMPLYLSRPFTRAEYVMGKLSVLLVLTSAITWIPGVLLFGIQSILAGSSWFWDNLFILSGILVGSWIWILTISLIALALSAWVKWRPIATAALFGIFFVAAGFGTVSNAILQMRWGTLVNLASAMRMVWRWLLLREDMYRIATFPFGSVPAWTGLVSLAAVCVLALILLAWRIRPTEVVR